MIGHIYIYGLIGSVIENGTVIEKGVELIDVVTQVQKQPNAESFILHLESDGGKCDVGYDIYNYLRSLSRDGKKITAIAEGRVASMGSVIFMAGDIRQIVDGAEIMIHFPWGQTVGTAEEIQAYADGMLQEQEKAVQFYCEALNLTEEAVTPLLRNETFIRDKDQLLSLGLITGVLTPSTAFAQYKPKNHMANGKENKQKVGNISKALTTFMRAIGVVDAQAKMIATDTGVMLDITNADGSELTTAPVEGAIVALEGEPAEGSYTLPEYNVTVEVVAGVVTVVTEAAPSGSADEPTVEDLKAQLAAANTRIAEFETNEASISAQIVELEKKMKLVTMGTKTPGTNASGSFRQDAGEAQKLSLKEEKEKIEAKRKQANS